MVIFQVFQLVDLELFIIVQHTISISSLNQLLAGY
jgi:hypothetical protein